MNIPQIVDRPAVWHRCCHWYTMSFSLTDLALLDALYHGRLAEARQSTTQLDYQEISYASQLTWEMRPLWLPDLQIPIRELTHDTIPPSLATLILVAEEMAASFPPPAACNWALQAAGEGGHQATIHHLLELGATAESWYGTWSLLSPETRQTIITWYREHS